MRRIDFLKGVAATFGIAAIPKDFLKEYRKIYLLQTFVRGFSYYAGPSLMADMKQGGLIHLHREPENEYDECAIALHYLGKKIGFLPMEDNLILSRLMDAKIISPLAEIIAVEPRAESWENLHVGVFVLQEITEDLPEQAAHLTQVVFPEYYSLKDQVVALDGDHEDDIPDGNTFYGELIEHSETDEIYSIIHSGFSDPYKMEEAVNRSAFVVNQKRLPDDLQKDAVIKAIGNASFNLNGSFSEDGFLLANLRRITQLSPRLVEFVELKSRQNQLFYEAIFR